MPPTPKPLGQVQRRNKPQAGAKLKDDGVEKRMPAARSGWRMETRGWWRDVWHSPMAAEFLEADKHALYRLGALVDQFWGDPTKELHAEIRQGQQAFGLTPIDRRRLQWEVERAESAARKKPPIRPKVGDDPRERLRVLE